MGDTEHSLQPKKKVGTPYILKDESQKKKSGRPTKYSRVIVTDEDGTERVLLKEINKQRFFYVSYTYIFYSRQEYGFITFATNNNKFFTLKDVEMATGIIGTIILFWQEFLDEVDFQTFQNKEDPYKDNNLI